jgi:hypothetical protein
LDELAADVDDEELLPAAAPFEEFDDLSPASFPFSPPFGSPPFPSVAVLPDPLSALSALDWFFRA